MVRPVTRAHKKMTSAAILNRIPAVVNTPIPEKAILTATALEPKRIHKNADKMPAKKENSGLSIFGLFIETTLDDSQLRSHFCKSRNCLIDVSHGKGG